MKNGLPGVLTAAAVMLAVVLTGCAQSGPVLLQNVLYQAPTGTAPERPKVVVGVSPFRDARGGSSSSLGKRTISDDVQNDLVVQGTVADLVTAALKDALRSRNLTVKDVPVWDLGAGSIRADGIDILIGGEIKALWVEAASRPLNVKIRAEVKLRVSAADAAEKKVLRTLDLNSTLERQDVAFSYSSVEGTLSEALSSALDQFLNDSELKTKIK